MLVDQILKLATDYNRSVDIATNKSIKDILLYFKGYFDGAAKPVNYQWYYNDFSGLYTYIAKRKEIPSKVLNDKYKALVSTINAILASNSISLQLVLKLDELWSDWNISNVSILKTSQVNAINQLMKQMITILAENANVKH